MKTKMKKIIVCSLLFASIAIVSQEKRVFEKEVLKISKSIEQITKSQKDSLKVKIIAIDKQLQKGEITKTIAAALKRENAVYYATQIEVKVGVQEGLLQALVQDKTNGKIGSAKKNAFEEEDVNTFKVGNKVFRFTVNKNEIENAIEESSKEEEKNKNRVTTTQFIFAMGVNNVLQDHRLNSLNDSEYKFWKSHFYELGLSWKTRLTKDASQIYFKYGLSFLWNNLRLDNNKFHVKNEEIIELRSFSENLSESRLRHVQMNFPVHLEWDFSKNKRAKDGFVFDGVNNAVRFGIGGFVGFKLGTRQYLEYRDIAEVAIEEVQHNNFNMNTVNYGLSTYLGYKSASLYVKYDLNPLFKDTEIRNISMGIRLDLN
jgi:hypothetical protein|tara:strand:+ start:66 stop:1181 length:1116 start_codon:yes stop_codon:yes gene_type:complete